MPTTAEFIAEIADWHGGNDMGENVRDKLDTLDALSTGDDALKHFGYTGGDSPEEKGAFLGVARMLLEARYEELENLGHKPLKMTLVAKDKLLDKLDLLLEIDTVPGARSLITGEMKDLVQPATTLPKIDAVVEKIDNAAEAITNALAARKLDELEQLLKDFNDAREELKTELAGVKHDGLKQHLTDVLCSAGSEYVIGETYRTAKIAAENKVTTRLGYAWNDAWEIAGNSFEYFTGSAGKKLALSTAVKVDPSFVKTLEEIDEKSAKGEDVTEDKAKALKLGEATIKTLDNLPPKLKEATPSFFGKLQNTAWGIVTSLTGK